MIDEAAPGVSEIFRLSFGFVVFHAVMTMGVRN